MDDCRYVWTYQNAAAAPPFLYNPDGSLSDIPSRGGAADAAAEAAGRGTSPAGGPSGAAGGRAPGGRGPVRPSERVHYKVVNCHLGKNLNLAGSGTGATLGYVPIDAAFLDLVGSRITDPPVPIEMNQRSRHYLHPVAGSEAATIGAGLFAKPVG